MNDFNIFEIRIMENSVSNKKRLFDLLLEINKDYPVAIDEKVNFTEYVEKIFNLGIIIESRIDEKTIGILSFYANNIIEKEGCYSLLGVLENYRRLGIASKLFERSFEIMKNNGMKTAYSFTHKENIKAIAFHEKMEFVIDLNRPNQYEYNISLIKNL